jgi:hypothetical protein
MDVFERKRAEVEKLTKDLAARLATTPIGQAQIPHGDLPIVPPMTDPSGVAAPIPSPFTHTTIRQPQS